MSTSPTQLEYSPERDNYNIPTLYLGQHASSRDEPLADLQYGHLMSLGFSFVTAPITNAKFHARVLELAKSHLKSLQEKGVVANTLYTPSVPDPVIPPITDQDTGLYPAPTTRNLNAYCSPWIDVGSPDPVISNVSRQVLNLEVNYANFCGVKTVIIPGPRQDATTDAGSEGLARFSRAIKEAMSIAPRLTFVLHLPMYREPGLDETIDTLTMSVGDLGSGSGGAKGGEDASAESAEIDLFSAWDTWDHIRSVCEYNMRLSVAMRLPKRLPERDLQTRWFSEPVYIVSIHKDTFQPNKAGYPSLGKEHQKMIHELLSLKTPPGVLLCDVGPKDSEFARHLGPNGGADQKVPTEEDFPSLSDAQSSKQSTEGSQPTTTDYIKYLKWLEGQQQPLSDLEFHTLSSFQDWLQSPLQPLSDNLESATYEVFEGDPVKYNQYEEATAQALLCWKRKGLPTSSGSGAVVIAVAGSGRGPLVDRALKASEKTGVLVEVWAVEKNPNAYVFLLRRNAQEWDNKVRVVRTDMRNWNGPLVSAATAGEPEKHGKVDILISELLGSFADNELSPECLDGAQHVLAPRGISIPSSYTAHMTPIATPRLHADLLTRVPSDSTTFDTPWVVRLFQLDFAARRVPGHPRFQQAWEFEHPLPQATAAQMAARGKGGLIGGVGGSMEGSVGANEHNARFCRVKYVCFHRGVTHGLGGYFESTLFECADEEQDVKVEISTHPERIDQKSKDMISWFPIFFPLKRPLHYPDDSELEVTMWRQTDDKMVWYEWMVEAYTWTSQGKRIKVNSSDLCSSRSVACKML